MSWRKVYFWSNTIFAEIQIECRLSTDSSHTGPPCWVSKGRKICIGILKCYHRALLFAFVLSYSITLLISGKVVNTVWTFIQTKRIILTIKFKARVQRSLEIHLQNWTAVELLAIDIPLKIEVFRNKRKYGLIKNTGI